MSCESGRLRRRPGRSPSRPAGGRPNLQHAYLLVHEPSKDGSLSAPGALMVQLDFQFNPKELDAGEVGELEARDRQGQQDERPAPQYTGSQPVEAHPGDVLRRLGEAGHQRRDRRSRSCSRCCVPTETSLTAEEGVAAVGDLPVGRPDRLPRLRQPGPGEVHAVHRRRPADPGDLPGHARGAGRRRRQAEPDLRRAGAAPRAPGGRRATASRRSPTASTAQPATVAAVAELNRIDDPMRLRPGDRLLLPPLEELDACQGRGDASRHRREGSMPHGEEFSNTLLVTVERHPAARRHQAAAGQRLRRRQHQRARHVRAAVLRRGRHRAREGEVRDRREGRAAASSPRAPGGPQRAAHGRGHRARGGGERAGRAHRGARAGRVAPAVPRHPGRGLRQHDRLRHRREGRAARRPARQGRRDEDRCSSTPPRTASATGTSCAGWRPSTTGVLTMADGKLEFIASDAGERGSERQRRSPATDPLVLERGVNLVHLRGTVTSSGQVPEVEVRGWDPAQKKEIVGTRARRP